MAYRIHQIRFTIDPNRATPETMFALPPGARILDVLVRSNGGVDELWLLALVDYDWDRIQFPLSDVPDAGVVYQGRRVICYRDSEKILDREFARLRYICTRDVNKKFHHFFELAD